MTRRGWLRQHLAAGIWSAASGRKLPFLRRSVAGALLVSSSAPAVEPAPTSADEISTLVAFAEVLGDGRALDANERRALAASIEHSLRSDPDRRALHRMTLDVLGAAAGRPFTALSFEDRVALVRRHRLDVRLADDDSPYTADVDAVRARAVPDLITAYWTSAGGWASLGYQAFPGRCGDLTRYTRPGP
jgi:hypothetical protein